MQNMDLLPFFVPEILVPEVLRAKTSYRNLRFVTFQRHTTSSKVRLVAQLQIFEDATTF